MKLPMINQSEIAGKRVFVRGDIDVPLTSNQDTRYKIQDDTRLKNIWSSVGYLLEKNCTVVLAGHLGRPGGVERAELSSRPVAEWFRDKIQDTRYKIQEISGVCLKGKICGFLVSEKLIVLENLRFDSREEVNPSTGSGQAEYAKELASLADVYVNEAFAASEREHASIVGVPKFLPHFAGFRLAKETEVLSGILESPRRPLVAVIGGAKPETKLPVVNKMAGFADIVIVGERILEQEGSLSNQSKSKIIFLEPTADGKDTILESIEKLTDTFTGAGTIIWNGPIGKIEEIDFQVGTRKLTELIAASLAYKVIGGGDTVGFVDKLGLTDRFDWVSSGGGSMLKLLAGEELPGIEVLKV